MSYWVSYGTAVHCTASGDNVANKLNTLYAIPLSGERPRTGPLYSATNFVPSSNTHVYPYVT